VADDRWKALCVKLSKEGYGSLSRPEKTWLNVRSLVDGVENGGAISYFYNPWPGNLPDCLEDLQSIGAANVRSQLERICELFPDGVPGDLEARNEVIDSWSDEVEELLAEIDEILIPSMSEVDQQLAKFLERSGLAI
jgi:hypothetical protein